MRLLVICPAYRPASAGEGEHCYQIAEHLAGDGHDVTVLTEKHRSPAAPAGFALDASMTGWRWTDLLRLASRLRRWRPDAVLLIYSAWLYANHPMITFLPTVMSALSPRARLLTLLEIYQEPPVASWAARVGRRLMAACAGRVPVDYAFGTLLQGSHVVAALGPTIVAAYARHAPMLADRALVIPPPPLLLPARDTSQSGRLRMRASFGVGDGETLLAYFGYVYKGKGVDTLIRALRHLLDAGRQVRLVMVGGGRGSSDANDSGRHDGAEAKIRSLAVELGVADRVAWAPGYEGGDNAASQQLYAADIAVLPFDEGAELRRSTIAVVTALGLPLVTTFPAVAEPAFIHGANAFLCPPRDPVALGLAIAKVAGDPELRARLRDGGLALARERYSWRAANLALIRALAPPESTRAP